MKVVIDTNIFISALSRFSNDHWVVEGLLDEKFDLAISSEIFLEYEEKLLERYNPTTVHFFMKLLEKSPNVHFVNVFFQWQLLNDSDHNKFVDAAFSSGVAHIVSEDRGFQQLQKWNFPPFQCSHSKRFALCFFPV
jgi:putative PIN family toxin of toxin-antitoxin system